MPYVPAIVVGRALPDFVQNPLALRRSQNSSSLISARRKEDNRIVAERRNVGQMPMFIHPYKFERPEGRPSPCVPLPNLMRLLPAPALRGELRVARERAAPIRS